MEIFEEEVSLELISNRNESVLFINRETGTLHLGKYDKIRGKYKKVFLNQNLYVVTNYIQPEVGDYTLNVCNEVVLITEDLRETYYRKVCRKIIATTDTLLIPKIHKIPMSFLLLFIHKFTYRSSLKKALVMFGCSNKGATVGEYKHLIVNDSDEITIRMIPSNKSSR